jgi:hypothetical protein
MFEENTIGVRRHGPKLVARKRSSSGPDALMSEYDRTAGARQSNSHANERQERQQGDQQNERSDEIKSSLSPPADKTPLARAAKLLGHELKISNHD